MHNEEVILSYLNLGVGDGVKVTPRGHDLLLPQDLPWHGHGSRNKNIYDSESSFFYSSKSFFDWYFSVWCQMYIKTLLFILKNKQKVSQQKPCFKKTKQGHHLARATNHLHKSNTTVTYE